MKDLFKPKHKFPERLALPSWVIPGTVSENAHFLHGKVREIALCCFEIRSCLNYTCTDLPPELALLNVLWHVHLPLDLDWKKGASEVAEQCLALREKVLFLHPHAFILHPPAHCRDPRPLLETFSKIWHSRKGERLFLENSSYFDARLLNQHFMEQHSFSFCLDPAHAIFFAQEDLLNSTLPEKAELLHWNAPAGRACHRSLIHLSQVELCLFRQIASRLSPHALHVLEIFDWRQILQSIPILNEILGCA